MGKARRLNMEDMLRAPDIEPDTKAELARANDLDPRPAKKPKRIRKQQSVHLAPDLVKKVKIHAVMNEMEISEVVEKALLVFFDSENR